MGNLIQGRNSSAEVKYFKSNSLSSISGMESYPAFDVLFGVQSLSLMNSGARVNLLISLYIFVNKQVTV
jgi:hypothetical protein